MRANSWIAIAVLIWTAAIAQSSFIPAVVLHLQTAVPTFLIVLAIARRVDFGAALTIGTCTGLLVDLLPPAAGPIGVNALVGALVAAAMFAWVRVTAGDAATPASTLMSLVVGSMSIVVMRALVTDIVSAGTPAWVLMRATLRDGLMAALLAPITLPLVEWLVRPRAKSWAISAGLRTRR